MKKYIDLTGLVRLMCLKEHHPELPPNILVPSLFDAISALSRSQIRQVLSAEDIDRILRVAIPIIYTGHQNSWISVQLKQTWRTMIV